MSEKQNLCVLALDTSTEACSAAVLTPDNQFVEYAVCPREHNKRILTMTQQVLDQAGKTLSDIDVIAYGKGPGSFTGVRIATGIVQGIAFGAQKPVVGVSSLAAMAHAAFRLEGAQQTISAIDARMKEIYLGIFCTKALGQTQALVSEQVRAPETALADIDTQHNWHATGSGWDTYQAVLSDQVTATISEQVEFPNALDIAYLGLTDFLAGKATSAELACPSYVRDQVTWQKLPGK